MSYKPEFKGPIEGWAVNYITKNLWRVARINQREDMLQEAYLIFMRVAAKYPDLDTPQHFMSLFQRSWINHFTDLANADTASRIMVAAHEPGEDDSVDWETMGDADNDGYLAVLLSQAPAEILSVLNLLLSAPQELLDLALQGWTGADRRCKAGGSKRICRMLGIDEEVDIMAKTEAYFRK